MAAAGFRATVATLACAGCTSIAVDAQTFENTHWRVTAINGRATPSNGDYHMEFEGGRISGRFGCNGWGGGYSLTRETLSASQVVSTLMACPEPAMSFESQGLTALRQPMHWNSVGARGLTLTSPSGSISLERQR